MGKSLEDFEKYFKEDLDAIEEELKKSKGYSDIIDNEINKLTDIAFVNKGGQHYLIEHIQNAVQLQSQRQSLRKDKFTIKKTIMDYVNKLTSDEDSSAKAIMEKLNELLANDKKELKDNNDAYKLDNSIDYDDLLDKVEDD